MIFIESQRTMKQQDAYLNGVIISAMIMSQLGNAFSKTKKTLPSYDDLFNKNAIPKTVTAYEQRKSEIRAELIKERGCAIDNS